MRVIYVIIMVCFYHSSVFAGSWFVSDNTVSTGKIAINGQDVVGSGLSIKGSGIKQTTTREVNDFTSINSLGGFDINYRQGKLSLMISGDDNIINHVLTEVVDRVLQISMDKSYSSKQALVINVSSPEINAMTIRGTSHLELSDINTEKLKINLLGSVDLYAKGSVSQLDLNIRGAGDIKIKSLVSDYVSVDVQGSGDVELTANKELNAKVSGVGDILFFGNPKKIKKQVSGVGDIEAGE